VVDGSGLEEEALMDFKKIFINPQIVKVSAEREEIEEFVVGNPYDLKGNPTNATHMVKEFVIKLRLGFPGKQIFLEDEKYTSKIATAAMLAGGMKKKDRRKKENIDKISATIILQSYLEKGNR